VRREFVKSSRGCGQWRYDAGLVGASTVPALAAISRVPLVPSGSCQASRRDCSLAAPTGVLFVGNYLGIGGSGPATFFGAFVAVDRGVVSVVASLRKLLFLRDLFAPSIGILGPDHLRVRFVVVVCCRLIFTRRSQKSEVPRAAISNGASK
jgi:hypothetical protein